MMKSVSKMVAMILCMLWCAVASQGLSDTEGTTFEPNRFLQHLGLESRPTPDQKSNIPDYMLRLYRKSTEKYLMPGVAVRSIKLEGNSSNASNCDRFSFQYDLSSLNTEEELLQATVRMSNTFAKDEQPSLILTSGKINPLRRRSELVFVATEDVAQCRTVAGNSKCLIVLEVPKAVACRDLNAALMVVTRGRQATPSRMTRSVFSRKSLPRRPLPRAPLCQRKEMYVDFREIGWSNWIIAPAGYSAYYCTGRCPFPISDHLNTTNHAIIQTLAHSITPNRVAPACCAPTRFAPISMLYYDTQNNVVLKQYDDMVVDACGCR